ncbi:questin oxidase family protein [Jatrophihabitans sp. YIM 134969]
MPGDEYDEALTRFHRTGPEFEGWLSNHGPMAADALVRTGHADDVEHWADDYLGKLEDLPSARFAITPDAWRDPLGDPSRLGDWLQYFARALAEASWTDVLVTWFPRLAPGSVASATHPLIRTGHVVRALRERETPERVSELGQALGYWAARWLPLPPTRPAGHSSFAAAFDALPGVPDTGGVRARAAVLTSDPAWADAVGIARDVPDPAGVPAALIDLVDTAVTRFASWAPSNPTMLVHMATAPRAALLVLPSLPHERWVSTLHHAWATSAAIAGMYRPAPGRPADPWPSPGVTPADVVAAAVDTGDEHAIKFAEVAMESHRRGNGTALAAADAAATLLRQP